MFLAWFRNFSIKRVILLWWFNYWWYNCKSNGL